MLFFLPSLISKAWICHFASASAVFFNHFVPIARLVVFWAILDARKAHLVQTKRSCRFEDRKNEGDAMMAIDVSRYKYICRG